MDYYLNYLNFYLNSLNANSIVLYTSILILLLNKLFNHGHYFCNGAEVYKKLNELSDYVGYKYLKQQHKIHRNLQNQTRNAEVAATSTCSKQKTRR